MHREDHAGLRRRRERGVDVDHRALEDVGGRALNRQIDGDALGLRPILKVLASQFVHQPPASVHRLHDTGNTRFFKREIDELAHPREAGEIRIDEFLRGLWRHPDVF